MAAASWMVVAAFVVLTVGTSLLGITTFLGVDLLTMAAPWKSFAQSADAVQVPFLGDTIDSVVPQSMLIVDAAREGQLAEWNPYQHGGAELGGLPNSGVYSPLSLPWWLVPHELAPGLVKLLEIVAAAVGFSLFLRRLKLPGASWAVATVVFVSSGFMISWTNWPQTRVAALIPLLFWALDRAAVRARWTDAIPVGLVVGSMLLGGFPAVTAYALYAGAAYLLVRSAVHHRTVSKVLLGGCWALAGVLLGFLLSAWQMVPFAVNATTVIDFDVREQTPDLHLPWGSLATAVVPDIFGTAGSAAQWGGAHPVERLSYVGIAAVVLMASALAVRPARPSRTGVLSFALVGTVIGIVLVYVGGVLLGLAQLLPVFSNNPVGRVRVVIGFLVALAAAYGTAALLEPRGLRRDVADVLDGGRARIVVVLRFLAATVLAVVLVVLVRTVVISAPDRLLAGAQARQVGLIGLSCAVLVLVAWFSTRRSVRYLAVGGLVVLLALPAASLARAWWPQSEPQLFYPTTTTHAFLDENLDGDRYATVGQVMLPGTSTAYRQRSLGGHVFMTPEWREVLVAADPDALLTPTYSILRPENLSTSITSPILDRMAVAFVVADPGAEILGEVEQGPVATGTARAEGAGVVSAPRTGSLRGVRVDFPSGIQAGPEGASIVAELLDDAGRVVTSTTTWVPGHSGPRWIAFAADDLPPTTTWQVRVSVTGPGARAEVTTVDGQLALDVVRPDGDEVQVAQAGDATVYERTASAHRVRWASSELVEEDIEARLEVMADPGTPASTVVLEDVADSQSPDGASTAVVEEISAGTDEVVVAVDANGAGWVVIVDSLRREGWEAMVDDQPAPMVAAEHVGGAVWVDEGTHVVKLTYSTPGLRSGVVVSLATIGALLVLGAVVIVRRLLARREDGAPGGSVNDG